MKARVKGLQMGVKMETLANVNPARLAQAPQAVIKGRSLIQAQGPPSCGAAVRLLEPISKARSHVWSKPFEQRHALALITAVIAEVSKRAAG